MSDRDEILDKIENEHRAGGHRTGPQAGCSLCAADVERQAALDAPVTAEAAVHQLAEKQAEKQAGRAAAAQADYLKKNAGTDRARRLAREAEANSDADAGTLGQVALVDAQSALDAINAGNYQMASAHALVGVIRALAGVEEQLSFIADHLSDGEVEMDPGVRERIEEALGVLPPEERDDPGPLAPPQFQPVPELTPEQVSAVRGDRPDPAA